MQYLIRIYHIYFFKSGDNQRRDLHDARYSAKFWKSSVKVESWFKKSIFRRPLFLWNSHKHATCNERRHSAWSCMMLDEGQEIINDVLEGIVAIAPPSTTTRDDPSLLPPKGLCGTTSTPPANCSPAIQFAFRNTETQTRVTGVLVNGWWLTKYLVSYTCAEISLVQSVRFA